MWVSVGGFAADDYARQCDLLDDHLEVETREVQGKFWTLRYPLADGSGHVEVATTRPETMLADMAVAVHPDDERYRDLVGKEAIVPFVERRVPIIADERVQPEFGTGALKITPGHDPNDFEIGRRHGLPMPTIMDESGRIANSGTEFDGLDRFDHREEWGGEYLFLGVQHAVEVPLYRVGIAIGAIVELDAFMEVKNVCLPAILHLPGAGQIGDDLEVLVNRYQRVEEARNEHLYLNATEVVVARGLAAAGFPNVVTVRPLAGVTP